MGITNIRNPSELMMRSGSMPCLMPELNCRLIVDGSAAIDADLDRFSGLLARGLSDKWIADHGGDGATVVTHASPCQIPRIHISELLRSCRLKERDGGLTSRIVYFVVVEGSEGAGCRKLVVRGSIEQIAVQVFFEAANGFNVVFGGLLLKRQLPMLGKKGLSFVRAKSIEELVEKEQGVQAACGEGQSGEEQIHVGF